VRNPKQSAAHRSALGGYRYYAGFSDEFVSHVLSSHRSKVVLDPWNGSGVTTRAASVRNLTSLGFDINPAMVVVAKANTLLSCATASLRPLTDEIVRFARVAPHETSADDPLGRLLAPAAARAVRDIENAIRHHLIDGEVSRLSEDCVSKLSPLAAHYYVALFETVREIMRPLRASNPTWYKFPKNATALPGLPPAQVRQRFRWHERRLAAAGQGSFQFGAADRIEPAIAVARSDALPIDDGAVDLTVTSPPYCTRLDYAFATLPELSVLGLSFADFRRLREAMIGTPTMGPRVTGTDLPTSGPLGWFLSRVAGHSSKASSTYYHKYFMQYYTGIHRSLLEMRRVMTDGGIAYIVVQDSYYKDIRCDLVKHIIQLASTTGFDKVRQRNFAVKNLRSAMNPRARAWVATRGGIESVVQLKAV
jgi:hypothetical protein